MAAIMADDIQISPKFAPRNPIDSKEALVDVMAWRRAGNKPLPQPMTTQFIDAYMQHEGGDELMPHERPRISMLVYCTVYVWELISNFTLHFMMDSIVSIHLPSQTMWSSTTQPSVIL